MDRARHIAQWTTQEVNACTDHLLDRSHRIRVHLVGNVLQAIIELTDGLAGHRLDLCRCGLLV